MPDSLVQEPTSSKGASGTFQGVAIPNIVDINHNDDQDLHTFASSSTGGQRSRIKGHQDNSGTFTMIQEPSFSKGAEGDLVLFYASGSQAFNGGAVIGNIRKRINIEEGNRIEWEVEWGQKLDASSGDTST